MISRRMVKVSILFIFCLSVLMPAEQSQATDAKVRVNLPSFEVKLNGNAVDNQHREYPLLVYKNITYFPMTWYDSRLLGLEASWSTSGGLNIRQSSVTSSYVSYNSGERNMSTYMAVVPTTLINVNGKVIDNAKEEYPLFLFRDVTYFPLTWRFAREQFGWDYEWNPISGLRIQSHNPQVQRAGLPVQASENDIALFKGYYYFVETTETTKHIYRAPVQQPNEREEIYSYPNETSYNNALTFQIRENELWFFYHLGGNTTGSTTFVKINDKGEAEQLHRGYLDFRDTPYGTLIINTGATTEAGNLYLLQKNGPEGTRVKSVGDQSAIKFAQHVRTSHSTATTVVGEDVYVLCAINPSDSKNIYRINLTTNKTELVVKSSVSWFRVVNNELFYVKEGDNVLYSSGVDGTGEVRRSDHPVSWFDILDGNVFYTTKENGNQYLHQALPNGEDPFVWSSPISSVQVINNELIVTTGESDSKNIVRLNSSGHLTLSVANPISRIFTSDNGLLFQTYLDSMVKLIHLEN
ncbi:DUF5050 domain-containing protein [Paenibacillus sp. YYML68]|uniref:DUF5050 domain-containing protein n=1 Tax=Paenibacillus sp. YYML68 TaxID=2909250 RepID=UPI0024929A02|nr:DUF5050 domain-containing protein [Paenibacillus sp. YYML68]